MSVTSSVGFKLLWNMQEKEMRDEVINFWKDLNALPQGVDPCERSNQIVYVALADGHVVAVTTAVEIRMEKLSNNKFYNYRVLVHPKFRLPGLVDKMGVLTINHFEDLYKKQQTPCVGVVTLVENEWYKQKRREAVWPSTGFVYIGNSAAGHHIRVRYFKGAKV